MELIASMPIDGTAIMSIQFMMADPHHNIIHTYTYTRNMSQETHHRHDIIPQMPK
jgi:ubiquinone biosynthesis protein COQ9